MMARTTALAAAAVWAGLQLGGCRSDLKPVERQIVGRWRAADESDSDPSITILNFDGDMVQGNGNRRPAARGES